MKIEAIHHIAILTSNELYDESKRFYTEVFRAERNSYKLDLALNGLYQIELFSFPEYRERNSFPEAKGLRHLAFAVVNVKEGYEWLRSNNIRTEEIR